MLSTPFKSRISREAINVLPIQYFDGKIIFIQNPQDAAECARKIMEEKLLGFDTETRPAMKKGVYYDPAIVQIATPSEVYIFQLKNCENLTHLIPIFESEKHLKVCQGVQDDVRRLKRLKSFNARGFIELSKVTEAIAIEDHGLKKLAANLLGFRLSKKEQTSNWAREDLSDRQLRYAATDAWVSRRIYEVATEFASLGLRASTEEKKEEEIVE
ncbi:MAG: 3'-5' exonuclease domain-containing protein 2 [Puniceicoccales bacterium]|jgi:ribonuclease D|nr:3'-5' exonuclease domain-containing protein 2 [Puniceicoccales bacterium]